MDKIIKLERDIARNRERANKLIETPKVCRILRCLGILPEELQYSLSTQVDVDLIHRLLEYIEECERVARVEALEYALECIGQFPNLNLANMYEHVRDKKGIER